MSTAVLRKSIRNYYETRRLFASRCIENQSSVRQAFITLLADTARPHRWLVVTEPALGRLDLCLAVTLGFVQQP